MPNCGRRCGRKSIGGNDTAMSTACWRNCRNSSSASERFAGHGDHGPSVTTDPAPTPQLRDYPYRDRFFTGSGEIYDARTRKTVTF